jgi:hypothetical protein
MFDPDKLRADVLSRLGNAAQLTPVLDEPVAADAIRFR